MCRPGYGIFSQEQQRIGSQWTSGVSLGTCTTALPEVPSGYLLHQEHSKLAAALGAALGSFGIRIGARHSLTTLWHNGCRGAT